MNGKTFEVGTDVHEITPRPNAQEAMGIAHAAFLEMQTLRPQERQEAGQYLAELAGTLLKKEQ